MNQHLIKSNQIHSFEKLTAKELYLISLQHKTTTPTSQKYFDSMFRDLTLQCKQIFTLPRITTIDYKLRCFQYKILHNTLYLNQKLFLFRKHNTSLCSFCNLEDEKVIHLFAHCSKTKRLRCTVIQLIFIFLNYHHRVPSLASLKLMIKYFDTKSSFITFQILRLCLKKFKSSFFGSPLEIHHESL